MTQKARTPMPLPAHLHGHLMAGCAITFFAGDGQLGVRRTNQFGQDEQPLEVESLAWAAAVLNAALAWRATRGTHITQASKQKAHAQLLAALEGR